MIRKSTAAMAATTLFAVGCAATVDLGIGATANASSSVTTTRFVAHDVAGNLALDDIASPKGGGPASATCSPSPNG